MSAARCPAPCHAAVLLLAVIACACGAGSRASGPALRPVSLPDVSQLVNEPVRNQLRERFASLTSSIDNADTPPAVLAAAYGDMGRLFLAADYFDAAEPCLLNAETLAPGEVRWPYYLGHVYTLKGDAANAAGAFERARRLRPDDPATLVWLGNTYLEQGRPDAAEPVLARALALDARSAAALHGLGRAALARNDYARAADYLQQALALEPQASSLHYPLALAYRGLGQIDKAEAQLRQRGDVEAALPDPLMQELLEALETPTAYERRAMRASGEGDWKGAAGLLHRAVDLAPEDAALRNKLGIALSMIDDGNGASAQFEEAIRLSPRFADAHFNLGLLLAARGADAEATAQFAAAVEAAPDHAPSRLEYADALRRQGRVREAASQYQRLLEANPDMVEARFGYAMTLVALKRYDEARARLAEGVKRFPDRPEFADALARLSAR